MIVGPDKWLGGLAPVLPSMNQILSFLIFYWSHDVILFFIFCNSKGRNRKGQPMQRANSQEIILSR